VIDTPTVRRLLFLAGVVTLLILGLVVYAVTTSPFFGPERTLEARMATPALALVLLGIGWAWIYRIVRTR
jgi:hypothetical protein